MCARYTLRKPATEIAQIFAARWLASADADLFHPRYNIAPSQPIVVIARDEQGHPVLRWMRWGLVPHWAPDLSIGNRLINARMETIQQKPAFREAVRHRRCIVPCDGFFEWTTENHKKIPHFIHQPNHDLLAFAGLWETWHDATGPTIESCTIVTRPANAQIAPLHDRMPVMLDPIHAAAWLHAPNADAAIDVLNSTPEAPPLAIDPVDPRMNKPTIDDPTCVEPHIPPMRQGSLFG